MAELKADPCGHTAGQVCADHGPVDELGHLGTHIADVLFVGHRDQPGAGAIKVSRAEFDRWKAHCERLGWALKYSGRAVAVA